MLLGGGMWLPKWSSLLGTWPQQQNKTAKEQTTKGPRAESIHATSGDADQWCFGGFRFEGPNDPNQACIDEKGIESDGRGRREKGREKGRGREGILRKREYF